MIMINNNWELVNDLSDIIRIVSENIGYEFAQKVEEIFKEQVENLEFECDKLSRKLENLDKYNKQT